MVWELIGLLPGARTSPAGMPDHSPSPDEHYMPQFQLGELRHRRQWKRGFGTELELWVRLLS
jgi:hypothetical protein